MKEPLSNIGMVCDEHAPKPGKYLGQDPKTFLGKICKLGFPGIHPISGRESLEHMWVSVDRITEKGELQGRLKNDPIFLFDPPLEHGDGIGFTVDEIEDVQP